MREIRKVVIGSVLTFVTVLSHAQCSLLDGRLETGHDFKKNGRDKLDPKKGSGKNELICLLKIDSIGSKNSSWFATILFSDKPAGQVNIEIEFKNKKTIKAKGQRPRLSELDTMYFEDNELLFPIDTADFDSMLNFDIVNIRITSEDKLVTFSPEKSLLKRLIRCLM